MVCPIENDFSKTCPVVEKLEEFEQMTGVSLNTITELDRLHLGFCLENKDEIHVRRLKAHDFEFHLDDRKLVFLYYRLCKQMSNIESIKKSSNYHGVVINQNELDSLIGEIDKIPKLHKRYNP